VSAGVVEQVTPTGNGSRLVAHLIDSFAWVIAIALVPPSLGLLVLLAWLGWWMVVATCGMSPGKKVMGLVCLDLTTGRPATFGKMIVRDLLAKTLLSTVTFGVTGLIGAIQIVGNDRRQALWDSMTDTLVVDRSSLGSMVPTAADPSALEPVARTVALAPAVPGVPAQSDGQEQVEVPLAVDPMIVTADPTGLDDRTVARTGSAAAPAAVPVFDVVATPRWMLSPSWDVDRSITAGTTVLVGRDPAPVAEGAEILRTPAANSAVSRAHCAVHLGDELRIEDLGSRNGTIVERPDGATVALRSHELTVVPDGSRVLLGDHSLVMRSI
jgi:hypothetical protein